MVELNKIYNCDNREILKQIPDKSIQVFLEDMPYGITACKWDKMPDLKEYWELRLSKIKDNGCFVLFGSEPFSSYLRMSNIKEYKYDWIWNKIIGKNFMLSKKQPLKAHEVISLFYKNQSIYNPIKTELKNIETIKRNKRSKGINKRKSEHYSQILERNTNNDLFKYPTTILNFKNQNCNNQFSLNKQFHPTQKPVALFEYLIKTYSNEGDLIFDGFSGSGTTAIACYNTNRNFICCELDKTYYDKSIIRLNEAKNNLFDGIK